MATSDSDPWGNPNDPRQPALRTARTIGMWLFLSSLFMLFIAVLIGYALIRFSATKTAELPIANKPVITPIPLGSLHMPALLYISTFMVVGVSIFLTRATRKLKSGFQRSYRNSLTLALVFAVGFVSIQAPAMISLVGSHHALHAQTSTNLFLLVFTLVLLHALHVLGGMIPLIRVTLRAHKGAYNPDNVNPIRYTAMYWHFLDVVWIIMFAVFIILR